MTTITDAHRAEARRRLDATDTDYYRSHVEALAQALAEPAWQPPEDSDLIEAREIAREAMRDTEVARTGVTKPVNGSAPYSWVMFQGQRVTFHDGEFTPHMQRTAGTEHAADYAQKINDTLFVLAVQSALIAIKRSKS